MMARTFVQTVLRADGGTAIAPASRAVVAAAILTGVVASGLADVVASVTRNGAVVATAAQPPAAQPPAEKKTADKQTADKNAAEKTPAAKEAAEAKPPMVDARIAATVEGQPITVGEVLREVERALGGRRRGRTPS